MRLQRCQARFRFRSTASTGLTLVELMIAISLMSAIMLALSTFMTATASAWKVTDNTKKTSMNCLRVCWRLEQLIRPSLAAVALPVGASDPTALLYWSYDNIGGSSDNAAARGEIGLIVYDAPTRTLLHYAPSTTFSPANLQSASSTNLGDLTQPSTITLLASLPFRQTPEVIAGPNQAPSLTPVDATVVSAVKFQTITIPGAKPIVRFEADLASTSGELKQKLKGSFAVRTPRTAGNLP